MNTESITKPLEGLATEDLISRLEYIIESPAQLLSKEERIALVRDVVIPRVSEIKQHFRSKFSTLSAQSSSSERYSYQFTFCFDFVDILLFSINNCPNQVDNCQNILYALAADFSDLLTSLLVHYPDPTTLEIFELLINLQHKSLLGEEFVSKMGVISSRFKIDPITFISTILDGYHTSLLRTLRLEEQDEADLENVKDKFIALLHFVNTLIAQIIDFYLEDNSKLYLLLCKLHREILNFPIGGTTVVEDSPQMVYVFEQWLSTHYPMIIKLLQSSIENQCEPDSDSTSLTPHQVVELSRFSLNSIAANLSLSDDMSQEYSEQIKNLWIDSLSPNSRMLDIHRSWFISDLWLTNIYETETIAARALLSRLDAYGLELKDCYTLLHCWKLGPIGGDNPTSDFEKILNSNVLQIQRLESQANGSTLWLHRQCGIAYFSRYPEALLIQQYNRDKEAHTNSDAPSKFPRKNRRAILVTAFNDHNGAFDSMRSTIRNLSPTLENSDVSIFEFGSSHQLRTVLSGYRRIFGRVDFLLLSGHGTDTSVMLGNPQSIEHDIRIKDIFLGLVAHPKQFFSKDALVILNSCSTAKSRANGARTTNSNQANNTSESAKSLGRNKYDYISTKAKGPLSGVVNIAVAMAKKFGVKVIGPEWDSAIATIVYTHSHDSFALPTSVEYKYFDDISGNSPPKPFGPGKFIEAPKFVIKQQVAFQ